MTLLLPLLLTQALPVVSKEMPVGVEKYPAVLYGEPATTLPEEVRRLTELPVLLVIHGPPVVSIAIAEAPDRLAANGEPVAGAPLCESPVTAAPLPLAIQMLPEASAANAAGALMPPPVKFSAMVKSLGCELNPEGNAAPIAGGIA